MPSQMSPQMIKQVQDHARNVGQEMLREGLGCELYNEYKELETRESLDVFLNKLGPLINYTKEFRCAVLSIIMARAIDYDLEGK